jgi:predicted NBD/HSP70 family sugar kinase
MRGGYLAGVDLGATNVRVVIADQDGNIEARRHFATPGGAPEGALGKISRAIDELVRGVWVGATVDAIGIALPGMVDPEAGVVASVANLAGWENVPLARLLGGGQRPVAMENDANAAAVGEGWLGASRGLRHHVFIALGTGIGSGVVVDGRVLRGAHHLGGEIAYLSMTREQVRAGGWQQNIESLVGGRAIAGKAIEIFGEGAKASELFEAARTGHAAAAAFVTEVQEYLAMAVVDVIALLDPEMVVFGGGVMAAQGAWLLDPIRELVHRNTPVRTKVVLSELGEDAQVIGAVRLAGQLVSGSVGLGIHEEHEGH